MSQEKTDITTWLASLGLEKYAETFRANEIDADVLGDLSEDDLKEMGLPIGPRRKILRTDRNIAGHGAAVAEHAQPSRAERRHLTVMFCDIVGSTELSTRLDPEDLSEVLRVYQDCCREVTEAFDGFLARYMGDGVLSYFGYPAANEDDAERAVLAGLEISGRVAQLGLKSGIVLAARVGIASGQVVVGEMIGEKSSREQVAVGETPNLAARLQSLAQPGEVVLSASTQRLTQDAFDYEDRGQHKVKGVEEPQRVWRVLARREVETRFDTRSAQASPLVGRGPELRWLLEHWREASTGRGRLVLLSGEPGIGKSRLVRALQDEIEDIAHTRISYQCSPHHTATAFYPIVSHLRRSAGFLASDSPETRRDKLARHLSAPALSEDGMMLLGRLLGVPVDEHHPVFTLTPAEQKQRTLEVLNESLQSQASSKPVLMIAEDVHWIDPSTRELIETCRRGVGQFAVLLVLTIRTEAAQSWQGDDLARLSLNRLSGDQSRQLVESMALENLPASTLLKNIVSRADGVPLFIEELTAAVLEAGGSESAEEKNRVIVPETLQDSLLARLDRLGPVREITQIGAALGRSFSHEVLAAVSGWPAPELDAGLARLREAQLLHSSEDASGLMHTFKHALVQDVAYDSMLRSERQALHGRIVDIIERDFEEFAHSQPERLADDCARAGRYERASEYWLAAGTLAMGLSAYEEAQQHLEHGLQAIAELHEGARRASLELDMRNNLGVVLTALKGVAADEVKACYDRARELATQVDDPDRTVAVLYGLWASYYYPSASYEAALQVAEALLEMTHVANLSNYRIEAHTAIGATLQIFGDYPRANEHLQKAIALLDANDSRQSPIALAFDPSLIALSTGARAALAVGEVASAVAFCERSMELASRQPGAQAKAAMLAFGSLYYHIAEDLENTVRCADQAIALASERKLPIWGTMALILRAWALVRGDPDVRRLKELERALDTYRASRSSIGLSWLTLTLADGNRVCGRAGAGLEVAAEALDSAHATGEYVRLADIHRIRGELLRLKGKVEAARETFSQAIDIARDQGALLQWLQASTALARLLVDEQQPGEAVEVLKPALAAFPPGEDIPALDAALELMEHLEH